MYDAFISYSRANLTLVLALKRRLDDHRLRAYMDVDSLRAGDEWPPQLGTALENSRLIVLCWSAQAAESRWVQAELALGLLRNKPLLPWLLDATPLPSQIQNRHGVQNVDPGPVASAVVAARSRHRSRIWMIRTCTLILLAAAIWIAPSLWTHRSLTFRGHVVDEQGSPVAGALVEAAGVSRQTSLNGDYLLTLPAPPDGSLRVTVRKPGFVTRTIDTRSDVPDLGVVLQKERP